MKSFSPSTTMIASTRLPPLSLARYGNGSVFLLVSSFLTPVSFYCETLLELLFSYFCVASHTRHTVFQLLLSEPYLQLCLRLSLHFCCQLSPLLFVYLRHALAHNLFLSSRLHNNLWFSLLFLFLTFLAFISVCDVPIWRVDLSRISPSSKECTINLLVSSIPPMYSMLVIPFFLPCNHSPSILPSYTDNILLLMLKLTNICICWFPCYVSWLVLTI